MENAFKNNININSTGVEYSFYDNEELETYNDFINIVLQAKKNSESKVFISETLFESFRNLMKKTIFLEKYKNETLANEINETIVHYNQDLLHFKKKYLISYDLLTRNINIIPVRDENPNKQKNIENISINDIDKSINMEENTMLKILKIYKEKKTKEIEEKCDKQLEELRKNDPVTIIIKETEKTLKEMLKTEDLKLNIYGDTYSLTQESEVKQQKILNTLQKEKQNLETQISEIEALLELAPNYEEKIQILRDYDIIAQKKNIIL